MPKSIHSDPYRVLLDILRAARTRRGVRQQDLVKNLGLDQSTISRIEQGQRRLDVIELRAYCQAIGLPLGDFIAEFERALSGSNPSGLRRPLVRARQR